MRRSRRRSRGRIDAYGIILGAAAMVLGSAALGIAVNHFSPRGIPIFGQAAESEPGLNLPMPAGVVRMSLDDARAAFDGGAALFVDARVEEDYREGHVPGALNVPPSQVGERLPEIAEDLTAAQAVLVYCHGIECSDAIGVAERLLEVVPEPVYVIEAGIVGWVDAGYPVREGAER